ncbi:MAG TPA: DUF4118 domain-containing protein [Chloroflexota bacterium]|nr:DUF4118 domain-containing protein [Chloroflexota bacterium]
MPRREGLLLRYGAGIGAVGWALVVSFALNTVAQVAPFPVFLVAVLLSAWRGGLAPGLLATLLSAAALDYFFLAPVYRFDLASLNAVVDLMVFALCAALVSSLSGRLREADRRARLERAAAEATWSHLQAIIDAADQGLIVFGQDGHVQYVNRWLRSWFTIHFGDVPTTSADLARVILSRQPNRRAAALLPTDLALCGLHAREDVVLSSRAGGPRRVRWRAAPIADHAGLVAGAVATWRDTTDAPDAPVGRSVAGAVATARRLTSDELN